MKNYDGEPWDDNTGSDGSATSAGSFGMVVNELDKHLRRYINPVDDTDIDLLTLWIIHTHFVDSVFYTTPRLLIDSPLPGSGKTTVLEHCQKLCFQPMLASTITSPALIPRMLQQGPRTMLVDEAEKSLRPDRPGVEDILNVINSGYKRGATRPTLVPAKGGEWVTHDMPTFSAVAMAGINPALPDDTLSRSLKVLLLPDINGDVDESDWEFIEADVIELGTRISQECERITEQIRAHQPELPEAVRGRMKEKWRPMQRVADMAGGSWPSKCRHLIERELAVHEMEKEQGMAIDKPAVALLRDVVAHWPQSEFWPTMQMVEQLKSVEPDRWGSTDKFPKGLTPQRAGRMLWKAWQIRADRQRQSDGEPRGYFRRDVVKAAVRIGITTVSNEPAEPSEPSESATLIPVETVATISVPEGTVGNRCEHCDVLISAVRLAYGKTTCANCAIL